MDQEKQGRGGPRDGSGRKPLTDKKEQVAIYIQRSYIERLGGMAATRLFATDAVETRARTLPDPKPKRRV